MRVETKERTVTDVVIRIKGVYSLPDREDNTNTLFKKYSDGLINMEEFIAGLAIVYGVYNA